MRAHLSVAILIFGLILAGCERDDKIVVYTTPKEAARAAPATPPMPPLDTANMPPSQIEIQWTVPAGWKQLPGDGQMRYASFELFPDHPEVQVTVIPLGAEAADTLPNVNRWEGQVGLPSTPAADLSKVVKRVTVGDGNADTVDLIGPQSANPRLRMIAAILPHADKTWFFKLFGPSDLVGTQKNNFDAFIQSIHFSNGGQPPPASPVAAGAAGASWNIPNGWQQEPDKPMRVASYKAGDAELVITQFGKDNFGGPLANINRWRNQAGIPPVENENQVQPVSMQINGKDAALFDFAGPANDPAAKRVRVAMVYDGEQVWFFKLVGPTPAVAQQQAAFDDFLKSVTFGGK